MVVITPLVLSNGKALPMRDPPHTHQTHTPCILLKPYTWGWMFSSHSQHRCVLACHRVKPHDTMPRVWCAQNTTTHGWWCWLSWCIRLAAIAIGHTTTQCHQCACPQVHRHTHTHRNAPFRRRRGHLWRRHECGAGYLNCGTPVRAGGCDALRCDVV